LQLNLKFHYNYLTHHGFEVELINSFYNEKNRFKSPLKSDPSAVIISTTFIPGKQLLAKLSAEIRDLAPEVMQIAGGPLPYMSYLLLMRSGDRAYDTHSAVNEFLFLEGDNEPDVDLYVVSLRGEQILCNVIENIREKEGFDHLPNCARLKGNAYHFSKRVDDVTGFEDVPIEWSALPNAVFKSGVMPMQASSGCPYHCAFCNFTKDHRLNWIKPTDRIVAEMKAVKRRGARFVWFVDDNFRQGKKDLEAFCRRVLEEQLDLNWMTFIRADTLDNIDSELLRRAGCMEVQLGLESADPRILKNMRKNATPELYDRVLKKLLSVGINCSCYFIFGFPGGERLKKAPGELGILSKLMII